MQQPEDGGTKETNKKVRVHEGPVSLAPFSRDQCRRRAASTLCDSVLRALGHISRVSRALVPQEQMTGLTKFIPSGVFMTEEGKETGLVLIGSKSYCGDQAGEV
jgi:hypothetical protein